MPSLEGIHSQTEPELIALGDIVRAVQDRELTPGGERRMHKLLQGLPAAVYTTDADGRITFYNDAAVTLWGCRPKLDSDRWCGSWRLYWPDGSPLPHDQCPMAIALKECRAINGQEAVAERPDGTRVPFMAYPSPLRDRSGAMVGAVNMLVDITERKRAEHIGLHLASIVEFLRRCDREQESRRHHRHLELRRTAVVRLLRRGSCRQAGHDPDSVGPAGGGGQDSRTHPARRSRRPLRNRSPAQGRQPGRHLAHRFADQGPRGQDHRRVEIARDISERKRKEELLDLLAREVDHRSKNLLALVQATVHLTQAETVAELKAAITGRLQALSNAHTLLAQSRWEGADLHRLIAEELSPYCEDGERRAQIKGPSLLLEPMTAQSIAVAVHELTTNAVKYGALSASAGRLQIDWERPGAGGLLLRWTEAGGPPSFRRRGKDSARASSSG